MKKLIVFNVIMFLIFVVIFLLGDSMSNSVQMVYNVDTLASKYYSMTGLLLEVFSIFGAIVQLIFLNIKLFKK